MTESKKDNGIMGMIKDGFSYISDILLANIYPPIAQGAEMVIKNVENKITEIEDRFMKKIYSLLIVGLGIVFLLLALLFFQIEVLKWSNATAFFSIGITLFVIGLLLKVGRYDR